jgi:hypothetical protein
VKASERSRRGVLLAGGFGVVALAALVWVTVVPRGVRAGFPWLDWAHHGCGHPGGDGGPVGEWEGTWYWLRSPEQEQRVVGGLFNRYCIRCHGVDGRGVWDIPDVPDFTNGRWQACRSDDQLVRIILEGRGAVMPAFRGTLTLEEAWAMARHLRTFAANPESRPDLGKGGEQREQKPKDAGAAPAPQARPAELPMPRPGQ